MSPKQDQAGTLLLSGKKLFLKSWHRRVLLPGTNRVEFVPDRVGGIPECQISNAWLRVSFSARETATFTGWRLSKFPQPGQTIILANHLSTSGTGVLFP